MDMNIEQVIEAVDLIKSFTSKQFTTITELAKELPVTKLKLMKFIQDNEHLFWLEQRWQPKIVKHRYKCRFSNKYVTDERTVRGKNLGVCVKSAYKEEKLNPVRPIHAEYLKDKNINYVYVKHIDYYGVMGYQILLDSKPDEFTSYKDRIDLWRNTVEKMKRIDSIIDRKEEVFHFGGLGDSYSSKMPGVVSKSDIDKLIDNGFTTNEIRAIGK